MRSKALTSLLVVPIAAALSITLYAGLAGPVADPPSLPYTVPSIVPTSAPDAAALTTVTFAIIGDYGNRSTHEAAVASRVASWEPSYVIAVGDDYYTPAGGRGTARYDRSTGAYYGRWLKDITTTGSIFPTTTAPVNAFFPVLGNHDYSDAKPGPGTYLTYFTLPGAGFTSSSGNERYYDFVQGPIHFFMLNSNPEEPDGTSRTSAQAKWLKAALAASTSTWNIACFHHPPYSSNKVHGSATFMRWPFAEWGADAVIAGHAHVYERVMRNGIPYFTNGLGGAPRYAFRETPVSGSARRYNAAWGGQKVTVTASALEFRFYTAGGKLKDTYVVPASPGSDD